MKTYLYFFPFLLFFSSITIHAQKIGLDQELNEIAMEKAAFYKVVLKNDPAVSYFYKSGNIFRKLTCIEGEIEGKFSEFYETGELKTTGRYKNNLREGAWKTYTKKGTIKEKGKYTKGKKVGVWKTFYKN